MIFLIIYLTVINLTAFLLYGVDKQKAKKNLWRIPESSLLLFSLLGGGIGSIIGMKFFKHKTQKLKFKILVPLLTLISFLPIYFIHGLMQFI